MKGIHYDVAIAGAGPAGSACAIALQSSGLRVALLDKSTFPRDKVCGDALSVDVVNQLAILSPELALTFQGERRKSPSSGVRIYAPSCQHVDIPFRKAGSQQSGFICTRTNFDNLLFQFARRMPHLTVFEGCVLEKFSNGDHQTVHTSRGVLTASVLVAADGAQSRIARQLGLSHDKKHNSAGLRQYYRGVKGAPGNYIELFFFRDILPGYMWIFQLPDEVANVGIGMLSSDIGRRHVNLRETFADLIHNHPLLSERFKTATPLEDVNGFGLPLGSYKRRISGDRLLLTGDAAGLIDPFTGEGIGNAIRSGRMAAGHIRSCFRKGDFSAAYNQAYDDEVYGKMWHELMLSRRLQELCRRPWLFNFLVRKANRHAEIRDMLTDALAHVDQKRILTKPGFYFRLLFM